MSDDADDSTTTVDELSTAVAGEGSASDAGAGAETDSLTGAETVAATVAAAAVAATTAGTAADSDGVVASDGLGEVWTDADSAAGSAVIAAGPTTGVSTTFFFTPAEALTMALPAGIFFSELTKSEIDSRCSRLQIRIAAISKSTRACRLDCIRTTAVSRI